MSKKLTIELIAQKVHSDKIESIRNLNLWGNNLDDISIIEEMPSLEIVSLSVNKIRTLRPFANLQNLRELYLRKNCIANLNEVKHLVNCENLTTLWLSENPICENKNYRTIVVGVLPQLVKLDDVMISQEERDKAIKKLRGNFEDDDEEEEQKDENEEEQYHKEYPKEEEDDYPPQKMPKKSPLKKSNYNERRNDMEEYNYNDKYNYKYSDNYEKKKSKYDDEDHYNSYQMPLKDIKRYRSQQINNNMNDYDDEEDNYKKKPPQRAIKNQLRQSQNQERYERNFQEKPSSKKVGAGNSNVLNSILLLLQELSHEQLQIVKRECDRVDNYWKYFYILI